MSVIQPIKPLSKKQEKIITKVQDGLNHINQFGIPIEMLNLSYQKDASDAAQMILSDENDETKDLLQQITGSSITIPTCMTFRYWYMINFLGDIAVNRFKIECPDKQLKLKFKKLLRSGILYSDVGVKDVDTYGVVCNKDYKPNGEIKSIDIQPIPQKVDMIIATQKDISFKDTKNITKLKGDDGVTFAYFRWNELGIGLFCLMMQDLCLDIYKKMCIDNNASNLISKPIAKVSSLQNFLTETRFNRNPFNSAKVQIIDSQSKTDGINGWNYENTERGNMWLEQLHSDLRFHQEYYYGLFGFDIGSAKEQVLSADTKMSGSRAKALQQDLLERIELFAEKVSTLWNTTITVTLEQENIEPENENADKENPVSESAETTNEQIGGKN